MDEEVVMVVEKPDDIIGRFANECIRCRECRIHCTLFDELDLCPGEIAQAVIQGRTSDEVLAAIQRCALCGRCAQDCPLDLNPPKLFKAAREYLIQEGRINPLDYDAMLVDRDWNFFSIYRDTYGIQYDDLCADRCEALFFPGCTLAAYAPQLTRAAFDWLTKQGLQTGFTDLCCGKPLDSIGLSTRASNYLDHLRHQLAATGSRLVITACPNCEAQLRAAGLPGIEIRSIYAMMVESGIHLTGSEKLTFHDSCPDRFSGQNPRHVRNLLSGFPQVEMASRGNETIFCGSGGIVSAIDSELCSERARRRMAEYKESGADTCVTSCMACSHRLSRAGQPGQVRHCLEIVFGIQVDYTQIERNTHLMWEGSQGETNLQRLAGAQALAVEQTGTCSHA